MIQYCSNEYRPDNQDSKLTNNDDDIRVRMHFEKSHYFPITN